MDTHMFSILLPVKELVEWQTLDPHQMLHSAASDLGLYYLLSSVCPIT